MHAGGRFGCRFMLFLVASKRSENEWKWVLVFPGDSVEASEVNTKSKRAIFLPDQKNRSPMGGARGMNEPCSKVLVNELMQSHKFLLGQGVNGAEQQGSAFVQCNLRS